MTAIDGRAEPSWAPKPKASVTIWVDIYTHHDLTDTDVDELRDQICAQLDGMTMDLDTSAGTIEVELGA